MHRTSEKHRQATLSGRSNLFNNNKVRERGQQRVLLGAVDACFVILKGTRSGDREHGDSTTNC